MIQIKTFRFNVLSSCVDNNQHMKKQNAHDEYESLYTPDKIDNEMLYAVRKNCVSYFITNDKKLLRKAAILGLDNRVLSINKALEKFKKEEQVIIHTPVFIKPEYLYNMDLTNEKFPHKSPLHLL